MKRLVLAIASLFIIVFVLPLLLLNQHIKQENSINDIKSQDGIVIRVFNTETGKIQNMDLEEYILGVVAGEMPADFELEALKAQALAARTYTLLRMPAFGGKGCSKHPGADICTDPSHCQAYRDPTTVKNNLNKLKQAIKDTSGEVIVYDGKLIDAVFHSTSSGRTENSEDVWSNEVPYLRSVMSQFDERSPKFNSKKQFNITDFIAKMKQIDAGTKLSSSKLKSQLKIEERSEGGGVLKMKVGNKVFKGTQLRDALGLNSNNFSFALDGKYIVFSVIGYGHGIGMSQYGADGMARNGSDYREIIKHYYSGVEIETIQDLKKAQGLN